jgi:hypothetical protein
VGWLRTTLFGKQTFSPSFSFGFVCLFVDSDDGDVTPTEF